MEAKMLNSNLEPYATWTFSKSCKVPDDVQGMLIIGEKPVCAYKTIRDIAIFTNKRLIVRDSKGVTGQKVEIYTVPYGSIVMYSTENAGKIFDSTSEIGLVTLVGYIKINLDKSVDVREIDKVLATYIL